MLEKKFLFVLVLSLLLWGMNPAFMNAQENTNKSKFRQLYQELPTPNTFRTASGAPGHQYWQQRADYDINVEIDDENQQIYGTETITYFNNSPNNLSYLWIQLDQNMRARNSDTRKTQTGRISDKISFSMLKRLHNDFDGGFKIEYVKDQNGQDLHYIINNTMMRVDLSKTLRPKSSFSFKIKWWYNINDRMEIGGRSGYEYFEKDDNYLYTIAQFYPRMAVYNETQGWQHKQFLGRGEFTLPFGNYRVNITVPSDHVVAATGVLQNGNHVLTSKQREQLRKARTASEPVLVINEDEARENEKSRSIKKKTWIFKAENVRDFGFASSRKFIWDAMGVKFGDRTVLAMSFYPKEGNPLWEQYSTKAVAHTLRVYSKYTFDYPYPVAISVHSNRIGMEYPMICFNGGRPEPDGTYSEDTKYGMISVVIHEVGHNFFPMIVNSDERQWTWMDEGFNTFLQYLAEREWGRHFPAEEGPAYNIVDYMKGDKSNISPIMTNSESIYQFGNNAYAKTATGLNILRETIMGRELFDFAFKEYARRWMFKHPTPADFFRTMEDASSVDLDWFWRGWFYTTDHVDLAIDELKWFKIDTRDPEVEKPIQSEVEKNKPQYISDLRNKKAIATTAVERDESLVDFYNKYDPFEVTIFDREEYEKYISSLSDEEKALIQTDYNYYEIGFSNIGGMVMSLILEFEYEDGSKEVKRIPAEIWRLQNDRVSKIFMTQKGIRRVTLDPFLETADVDMSNNYWPPMMKQTRFKVYKSEEGEGENPMQRQKKAEEEKGKEGEAI